MQKSIQYLSRLLLTVVVLAALPSHLMGQTPTGWLVEFQEDWIRAPFGYCRCEFKISTSPPAPAKQTTDFQVVVKQFQNGREHLVSVTPITVREGDTFAEADVLINQTNDTYNNYHTVHVESDGNLNFEPNRDLISLNFYVSGNFEGLPTILFISSAVTNKVTRQLRTKRGLINVAGGSAFAIDDAKFPAVDALYQVYPDVNGQPVNISGVVRKNPTALDIMESPSLHAIAPANVPGNWLALTAAEIIVVSYEDLAQIEKAPAQLESIRKWVAAGGTLVVNHCGADYKQAPRIRMMIDGQVSLSARRKSPWIVPGEKVRKLKKFVVQNRSPINYYYGAVQPDDNQFTTKDELREMRQDWQTIPESADLAKAIGDAECEFAMYQYLLGRVVVVGDDMLAWKEPDWKLLLNSSMTEDRTIRERFGSSSAAVPADNFAIQGVGKPPVQEFQYLIGLFVLAIGPVSYFILKRQRRLQLLFLTVPAISLMACLALVLYALLSDGFQNRGRIRSFTEIDHSRQRAVSFARHSHYAGVQPDDYVFENDEAVFNGRSWSSPRSIMTQSPRGTSLNGGDIRPRMPHQIVSIRNYDTPQRLALLPASSVGGPPGVQNQFDDPIRFAILRTDAGYFFVENLAAGDSVIAQEIPLKDGQSLASTTAGRELARLPDQISPKVTDEFFNRATYTSDPYNYYGYNPSATDFPASVECDYELTALRTNLNKFFAEPGQYVAVLEEFSGIPSPQPNIEYKNKLHIIHGKW